MKKKKEELGIARKRITKPGSEKALIERTKRMLAGSIGGGDMVGPGGGVLEAGWTLSKCLGRTGGQDVLSKVQSQFQT